MRSSKRCYPPCVAGTVRYQRSNAYDPVKQVLGELIPDQRSGGRLVRLLQSIDTSHRRKVRHCLYVPNNDVLSHSNVPLQFGSSRQLQNGTSASRSVSSGKRSTFIV